MHTLQSLLDEAAVFAPEAASLRPMCERVSGFYVSERYPNLLAYVDR